MEQEPVAASGPGRSRGRRRVGRNLIEDESSLAVTFSKRRSGLFKKASELCTLTGVEMAIFVFSHNGKKVYSFGNPNAEAIVARFTAQQPQHDEHEHEHVAAAADTAAASSSNITTLRLLDALRKSHVESRYEKLTAMHAQLESEKKAGKELLKAMKERQDHMENLGLEELQRMRMELLNLKAKIAGNKAAGGSVIMHYQ